MRRARDRAVDALSRLFSADDLTVEELEDRLDRCYRSRTVEELEEIFDDLPVAPELSAPARPEAAAEPAPPADAGPPPAERPRHDLVLAVMSGVRRSGRWTPPRHMSVLATMGGAELDFRQARFPPGETTVTAVAFMGGVEVVVPPGLCVECSGVPLMGGFERLDQDGDGTSHPDAVLKIRGVACMGSVEVKVRGPRQG